MKGLLAAALLLCGAGASAQAEPGRAVLLAVPAEDFSQWEPLAGAISGTGDLKLTLALTPGMLTPQARDALAPLIAAGRLELAMRIPGDPILPLVQTHSAGSGPQDSMTRIALARERFRSVLSTAAAGFVPGSGAVTADLAPVLQAMAVPWVAVGPAAGTAPSLGQPAFLPFSSFRTDGRVPAPEDLFAALPEGAGRVVLDEAGGLVPRGSLLALLRELARRRAPQAWDTVAQSLSQAAVSSATAALQPGAGEAAAARNWAGWGIDTWSGAPGVEAAWKAYARTAADLKRYQNSGTANLKALESATDALYAAQASRYYRLLAWESAEAAAGADEAAQRSASVGADRQLRQHLMAVYRRLKQPVPGGLYASFLGAQAPTTAEAPAEEASTDVRVERGTDWMSFQNPAGSLSRAPESLSASKAPGARAGAAAADPWRILSLRVAWDAASVVFAFRMAGSDVPAAAPAGLGRLVLDVYMDINHVPGAGNSSLLEGRGVFAGNRDCWEYALSLAASGGTLFRATPDSSSDFLASIPVSVDPDRQTIRAVVPRSVLRGTPSRWGYIAAAFAAKPSRVAPSPSSAPAVLPGGPLGVLAPLEQQKGLSPGQRLNAVRASE